MNVQNFMTSMMMKDGFGSGIPGSGQQNGKPTDKSFQDMLGLMGLWMMAVPGMTQQDGQNQADTPADGMPLMQITDASLLVGEGGTVPEGWNPPQAEKTADSSLFLEKMALLGRQNRVVAEAGGQDLAGENLAAQMPKEDGPAGMDLSGWQLPKEGADEADADMPKEPLLAQMAQLGAEKDTGSALTVKDTGDLAHTREETAGKPDADPKAEALTGTLEDSSVSYDPKPRMDGPHAEMPVYHHQVEDEQALGKDLSELVSRQIRTGRKEFEIQLEPQNLGKITIKVSSHDNQTTIAMLCSEEKTLGLLAQNAKELGAIMENNLGAPTQILVEKQAPDYLNQENSQKENQQKEQQKEQQREKKHSGGDDFIQKLRLGMMSVS